MVSSLFASLLWGSLPLPHSDNVSELCLFPVSPITVSGLLRKIGRCLCVCVCVFGWGLSNNGLGNQIEK